MKLEIGLFGVFTASLDGAKIRLHPGQAALVAYLALAGGRLVPRTRVAGALWPDLSEDRAKANLSTVIWRLRGALSKHGFLQSIIQASPDSCGLDPEQYQLDVEQFVRGSIRSDGRHLSLEALGRAARALDLYRGDLLEDWDVEWCRLEREHLRERYVECARAISEGLAGRGRFDLALRYARLAVAREPMDERSQRNLIRLLFLSGDRVSALHHFNGFARLVRSELGTEPDDETLQLVGHIRRGVAGMWVTAPNGGTPPVSIHPERVQLVGRIQEKSELDGWIEAVFAGSGGGVLLLGESGIGKTRLVEWAMEEWCARGGEYACGRCVEFNEPVPYQPVLDALERHVDRDDVLRVVRYLEPVEPLTRAHGESDLPRDEPQNKPPLGKLGFLGRFASAIEQAARLRPFLLVIEDLQWADTGTLDFVAYMLERSRSSRLGILLSAWPPSSRRHHREWVSRLGRQCTMVMRLEPLTEVETGDLASRLLGGVPVSREAHAWILRETEGNPLFVVETLRLLCQRGQIGQLTATSFAGANLALSVPDRVRSAVGQRLGLIRRDSLRLAEVASVLGRAFDDEMLRSIAGMSENRLSRAVDDLVAVGVLVREKSHLRFSHDKVRAVCYDRIPQARKRVYHARAAAALAERPQLASHLLAWHQESAGQWYLATKSWIEAASESRAVCAFHEALKSYRRALECLRRDTTVSVDERNAVEMKVLTRLDEALGVLGHLNDRRVVLSKLGELCRRAASPSAKMEYFMRSAHFQEHIGDFSMAAALARRARSVAQLECNDDAEAKALVVLSRAYLRGGRYLRALCAARLALQKARGEQSDVLVEALYQAAAANIALGDFAAGQTYLRRAKESLIDLGYSAESPQILLAEASLHKWNGDLEVARACLAKGLQLVKDSGDTVTTARIQLQIASLDSLEGKLGEALRGLRKAASASRAARYVRTYASFLNEVAYGFGRLVGNYAWSARAVERAVALAAECGNRFLLAVVCDTRTQLLIDQGCVDEALSTIGETIGGGVLPSRCKRYYGPYLDSLVKRGVLRLRCDLARDAVADLQSAAAIMSTTGPRLSLPDTLTYLALAYAKLGETQRAIETSEEAIRILAEMNFANHQPQRIFWHHYLILGMAGHESRLAYLERAVQLIEAQAATLSPAQGRRLRREVPLNREILEAWHAHRPTGDLALASRPASAPAAGGHVPAQFTAQL